MVHNGKISKLVLNSNFRSGLIKKVGILICLLQVSVVFAQAPKMEKTEADELFSRKHYSAVWEYYREQLKLDSLNPDLNYKMGICYLNSRSQKQKAIECLNKVINAGSENVLNSDALKYLADAYYELQDFDRAMLNYERYGKVLENKKEKDERTFEELNYKIELCSMGKEVKQLKKLTCTLMKHKCNIKNNTYNSILNQGWNSYTLTAKKPFNLEKTLLDDDLFENGEGLLPETFTISNHKRDTTNYMMETTVATSEDGQIILIYRNENGIGNLYVSRLQGNDWMLPEKLSRNFNDKGWEAGEVVSLDGNTLYFSSAREGGYGGKDIYKCSKLPNGEWGRAINLGPSVNSPYDEEAPFIHPDGTLFFSSNRYKTKGGYNNYKSAWCDSCGGWTSAEDVSYPSYKHNRNVSKGIVEDELDNYRVNFINPGKVPLTLVKGKVNSKNEKVLKYIEITVTDNETGNILAVYYPDQRSGKYIFVLPSHRNLNITYEADGYLFHSENMVTGEETSFKKIQKSITLETFEENSKTILSNVFFEEGKASLTHSSETELDRLYNVLKEHPKFGMELFALPDKENENNRLSEDRVEAVINYLVEKGIGKERLTSKSWRKVEKKKRRKKVVESISVNGSGKIGLKLILV